ncbi:DUF2407 ubiquitin-like domain-containing protein [Podospora australis]|uniref:DUF2407 ubiquitin-like domain-containing protein n=1 Tax=Podospora australis TaxID=1536484 RepID=A0AAN6WXA3_9PEZI|nr:DUF2407 ubiquitin-like domain-containing protein [Podospora australis]
MSPHQRNASASSSSPSTHRPKPPPLLDSSSLLAPPTPRSPRSPSFPPPLHITIRFSTSVPDLELDIPHPAQTTVVSLKHLIRTRLDSSSPASKARLRFIHNGRILPDPSLLSSVLRTPPPAGGSLSRSPSSSDIKGKGVLGAPPQQHRIFINCSIGDPLSDSDLAAEATLALSPSPSPSRSASPAPPSPSPGIPDDGPRRRHQNEPRGFDRLAPSLTREEITHLRLAFRAHHASRYTAETMPSPTRMLAMEDAWLDNDSGHQSNPFSSPAANFNATGEDTPPEESGEGWAGNVDGLVRGIVMGCLFPLGMLGWLLNERRQLWSKRQQIFITMGIFLCVFVGLVRELTGPEPS